MRSKYFFVLIVILFSVFWVWWLPGPRVANDFSFISKDWLKLQFDIPRVWNERGAEGLGEYGVFILWSYPVSFVFGVLAHLGLNFEIWERILILLFIFLGSISIWKFLSFYLLSPRSKFIGSLFYLINTYSILLIDGGQISIALAYGLFPLAFLKTLEAVQSGLAKKILAGLVVAILGFFDIRFIYILFLLFLIRVFFELSVYKKTQIFTNLWKWVSTAGVLGIIIFGLNSFWLIAQIKTPLEKEILLSFTRDSENFVNIGHSLLVISPHWYQNVFGQISPLRPEFILLPTLVFLAPILRRKDKNVLFWLLTAAFSIFLAKGGSEPLGTIYPWLHANIAGFSFFRDSTKFFFLITLSYALLISISSEEIMKRILKGKRLRVFYLLFITIYLLYLIRPVLLNQMTGTFSIQPTEEKFQSLSLVLQNDKDFGRVFWIPATAPLSYSDLNHPIVEASRIFNRRPFVYGIKGTYETFNFLREAPYMGEIFDIAGISYIAYPPLDVKRFDLHPDNIKYYYTFLNQLTNLPWIEKVVSDSKIPLLKTRNHQDKIFITNNTWIVFGSDEIFSEATKSAKLKLSDNAIIFAEGEIGLGSLIRQYPEAKILLNKKTNMDLMATFIPQSKIVFPAQQLKTTPDKSGWWKNDGTDLIYWRDFLQKKYNIDSKEFDLGGGWAVGEGNRQLIIDNGQLKSGDILLARVMESTKSGTLSFYQDDKLIGTINTKAKDNTVVRWFEVGVLQSLGELIIKTEGDINIINALAFVDPDDLANYKKSAEELETQIADFNSENVLSDDSSITYQRINQTEYKIIVFNLVSPKVIVFSSTFHPLWKLEGQGAVPVYGFLNGFRVDKNGEYVIEFEPQKYVKVGLIITGLTLGIFFVLWRSLKSKS